MKSSGWPGGTRQPDSDRIRDAREMRRAQADSVEITISAWRCDNCRKFQPMNIGSTTVYVEDHGPLRDSGPVVKARSRFITRMIVDPVCARALGYERTN